MLITPGSERVKWLMTQHFPGKGFSSFLGSKLRRRSLESES